jgi:hypothetical protein
VIRDDIRPVTDSSQESKGDRTRKRLLDAAAAEVARCGVAGTSINAIATRLGAAIRAHATAVHELSNYTVAVLGPSFPSDAAGATARKLRRTYVSRWTRLVIDAQGAGVLAREPDPRLLRDLILGALNAVSLAGQPSDDVANALRALLGIA